MPFIIRLILPKSRPRVPGGINPIMHENSLYGYCARVTVISFGQGIFRAALPVVVGCNELTGWDIGLHELSHILWGLGKAPCPVFWHLLKISRAILAQ